METKQFVGSFVNVILTLQTCGQRSSRATESKRRALGNCFPEWICLMFQISKCRGDWNLGLCTCYVLAKREPLRNGDFREKKRVLPAEKIGIWHCAALLLSQVPNKLIDVACIDLDLSLLYILTWGTYSKFARENNFPALGVCFQQPCSSAGHRFAASRSPKKH